MQKIWTEKVAHPIWVNKKKEKKAKVLTKKGTHPIWKDSWVQKLLLRWSDDGQVFNGHKCHLKIEWVWWQMIWLDWLLGWGESGGRGVWGIAIDISPKSMCPPNLETCWKMWNKIIWEPECCLLLKSILTWVLLAELCSQLKMLRFGTAENKNVNGPSQLFLFRVIWTNLPKEIQHFCSLT